MEPVGLALGVVGLAGLFSTCLDAVERFESWRNFKGDSRLVQTLVQGQKLRLKRWGHAVGIDLGVVSARHHHALDDPQMLAMIRMDLLEIQSICTNVDSKLPNAIDAKVEKVHGLESSATPRSSVFPDSKRRRMKWALGDKAKFTTQTQTLASLVQNLHDLVPVETGDSLQPNLDVNSIDSVDGMYCQSTCLLPSLTEGTGSSLLKDPWTTELKQILTRLDGL